jgi:hypothetical protein
MGLAGGDSSEFSHAKPTNDRNFAQQRAPQPVRQETGRCGASAKMAIDQAFCEGSLGSCFLASMSFCFSKCASNSSSEAQS